MSSLEYTPTTGVVVTGGASGIGRGCAEALAEVGRPVAIWDLDGAGAKEAANDIAQRHGVAAVGLALDVRDTDAYGDAVRISRDALGSIGCLVHAAGMVGVAAVDEADVETWDAVLGVNLRAESLIARALLPELRAANPGSAIVGIASIEAFVAHAAIPAYCASKAGLLGLTRSMALHLAPEGIRVNAVCPGYIETPMLAPAVATPEARTRLEGLVPMGRLGLPADIARVVRFLLSDEAGYVTGTEIVVDGGAIRGSA